MSSKRTVLRVPHRQRYWSGARRDRAPRAASGVRCVRAPRAGAQRRKEREGVRLTLYTRPPDPQRTDRRTGGTRPSGQRREEAPDRHKAQQITQKQDLFESKAQTHDQPRTHSLAGHTRNKPQTNSFTQTNTRPARLNNSRRRHHTPTPATKKPPSPPPQLSYQPLKVYCSLFGFLSKDLAQKLNYHGCSNPWILTN